MKGDAKDKKAVALKYEYKKDRAPQVVAKGRGWLAEKITELAREHHIPVYPDKELVAMLETLDVMAEIPPELYVAVAEVLAFVYRLNKKHLR